ncbi:hypothetical protein FOCC_FOCC017224, partial [Frankliniella occidentalis]
MVNLQFWDEQSTSQFCRDEPFPPGLCIADGRGQQTAQASSSTTPVSRNSVRSERTSRLQDPVNIHQPTSVSQGISTPIPAGSPGLSNLILDSASNSALLSQSNQK